MTLDRFRRRHTAANHVRRRNLWHDRRGVVALMFGLVFIPLMLLLGLAVDFAFITQARAQLDLAADTAALTATRTTGAAFTSGAANYIAQGQTAGLAWFNAQVGSIPDAALVGTPTVTVTQSGNAFTSAVTYTASVTTLFEQLFLIPTVSISNNSAAEIVANAYVDVTFLLDNSSSMLIAATPTDIATLQPLTAGASCPQANGGYNNYSKTGTVNSGCSSSGSPVTCTTGSKVVTLDSSASTLGGCYCAFACHWDSGNNDYYGIAQSAGVTLRLNVLQSALSDAVTLLQTSETTSGIANQFGAQIYQFNSSLQQVWPPTADSASQAITDMANLAAALTAAEAITTPVLPDEADTNFPAAMTALVNAATPAGDGSTQAKAKKSLIIITDGIQDYCNPLVAGCSRTLVPGYSLDASTGTSGSYEGPLSMHDCDAIKGLGYTVYVLYTTYYVPGTAYTAPPSAATLGTGQAFSTLVPFSNSGLTAYVVGTEPTADASYALTTNLKGCSSDPNNDYVEASDPTAIRTALEAMVRAAINSGSRLTL